ncbi:peptidyl-prolyl cis-trans isomerase-like [Striga asiatica]|uniref:Peptidyl-prolyl cis-trans isomerase-like n=1 Tax=Striga asiatica TaxID=4170 RepID=A0A5A7R321_STRAF|nr:peptidyl-prolyl cis-trans isomerase-like [Striga asiatica]
MAKAIFKSRVGPAFHWKCAIVLTRVPLDEKVKNPSRDQIYGRSRRGGNAVVVVHIQLPEADVGDLHIPFRERTGPRPADGSVGRCRAAPALSYVNRARYQSNAAAESAWISGGAGRRRLLGESEE